ncbi:hypothetical protein SAMN05421833_10418 [Microbispora rosea]|uniref:Uncharacterized protein n=1 Tax=Microbispora rosea TaxID=58117 RepID=A0A1N6VYV0_9ACTN|nr:hypothetical protein [Microbispora rosea]GIH51283.1 hypothetical protein Mro03_64620 [Microbispora rosea subsp. rosea]SIQ82952.1 hypothetical protein SAMN05421833_10418 [Microbispora rosea]
MDKVRVLAAGLGLAMILAGVFARPITVMNAVSIDPTDAGTRFELIVIGAVLFAGCLLLERQADGLRLWHVTGAVASGLAGLVVVYLTSTVAISTHKLAGPSLSGRWQGRVDYGEVGSREVTLYVKPVTPGYTRTGQLMIDLGNGACVFGLEAEPDGMSFAMSLPPDGGGPVCRDLDGGELLLEGTPGYDVLRLALTASDMAQASGTVSRYRPMRGTPPA